jgi:hypothetical protein
LPRKRQKKKLGFTSPITLSIIKRQARKLNKISNSCETSCNRSNCSFRFKTREKKPPQQEHGSHFSRERGDPPGGGEWKKLKINHLFQPNILRFIKPTMYSCREESFQNTHLENAKLTHTNYSKEEWYKP